MFSNEAFGVKLDEEIARVYLQHHLLTGSASTKNLTALFSIHSEPSMRALSCQTMRAPQGFPHHALTAETPVILVTVGYSGQILVSSERVLDFMKKRRLQEAETDGRAARELL